MITNDYCVYIYIYVYTLTQLCNPTAQAGLDSAKQSLPSSPAEGQRTSGQWNFSMMGS